MTLGYFIHILLLLSSGGGDGCGVRGNKAAKQGATVQVCNLTKDNSLYKICKQFPIVIVATVFVPNPNQMGFCA